MRLVLICNFSDGCTYSCKATFPMIYDSVIGASEEFEKLCYVSRERGGDDFEFCGESFSPSDFFEEGIFYGPQIISVDTWFADKEIENELGN